MSFVNNPGASNLHFIGQTGEILRTSRQPQSPATSSHQHAVKDQVEQSSGHVGQAQPISFLDNSPRILQLQQSLQTGKTEALLPLLQSMSTAELSSLQLSSAEISKIADALGKNDLTAALPLVGSYTAEEQEAVKRLIRHTSHLDFNQKLALLRENVGPGAAIELIQSARPEELKQLTHANKFMVLTLLDPGSSAWGSLSGAGTELLSRRAVGHERLEDRLAGQILRAASDENELRGMLQQLNQFSRDDAAYHYVMSLSPQELSKLSEGMKKELLQHLIDTGLQLPLIHIDLNNMANLDETLKMTFKEHMQAARALYIALAPQTRQSESVQTLIGKSDDLSHLLSQIETELQREQQAGKLSEAKIQTYRQQIETLQQQAPDNPMLKAKAQELLKTLSHLQQQIQQTAGQGQRLIKTLTQSQITTQNYAKELQSSQKSLEKLQKTLPETQSRLKTAENKMLQQYTTLLELRKQLQHTEPRYLGILQDMETALQSPQTQKNKLQQLDSLNQQLKHLESRLDRHTNGQLTTLSEIQNALGTLADTQAQYLKNHQEVQKINTELKQQHNAMAEHLSKFENQIRTLEHNLKTGQAQYQELQRITQPGQALEQISSELDQIGKTTHQYRNQLENVQKQWQSSQKEIEKLLETETQQQESYQKLNPVIAQIAAQETALMTLQSTSDQTTESLRNELDGLLSQVRNFTTEWSTRLNTSKVLSESEIQKCKTEIKAHLAALESHQHMSPEAIKQDMEALKILSVRLSALEGQLHASTQLSDQLSRGLEGLQTSQKSLEQEWLATQNLLTQTRESLSKSEARISELHKQITTFQADLQQYHAATQDLEAQLNQVQENTLQARRQYGQGIISGAELTRQLQQHESHEAELNSRLEKISQDRSRIQQQLTENQKSLTDALVGLNSTQKTLTQKIEQAEQLSTALQSMRDQNAQSIESSARLLSELQNASETQPALKEKMSALGQLLEKLRTHHQTSGELIEKTSQTLIETLPLKRQTHETIASIQTAQTSISRFEHEHLQPVHQEISRLTQTLETRSAETAQIRQTAEKLAYSVQEKDKPFALEDIQTQIEQIIQTRGLPAEQVKKLLNLKTQLEHIRDFRHQGEIAIEQHRKIRHDHLSIYNSALQSVADVRTQLKLIETAIGEAESELKNSQTDMLQTQRRLLEQRKQMGLQSSEYRVNLERYEQLLGQGKQLNQQEIEELQTLERNLGQLEQELGQQSHAIQQRMESLNTLKEKLNTHIDQMRTKTKNLLEMRTKLSKSLLKLQISRGNLLTQNKDLQQQKQQFDLKLAEIEQLLKQFPGSKELQEIKRQLQQEHQALGELLATYATELQATDQDIANSQSLIENMDQTLLLCKNIQEKLMLFIARTNDLLAHGQKLLDNLEELTLEIQSETKPQLQAQQSWLTETVATVAPPPLPPPSPPPGKYSPLSLQGIQQVIESSLPGFVTQRRQADANREQTHQKQRDKLLKILNQQIKDARNSESNWRTQIEQDQALKALTEELIQQHISGARHISGINLVGLNIAESHNTAS